MGDLINILIVDDLDLVRKGIRHLLSDIPDINVVGEAKNGDEAIKLVRELSPHIVLLDLKMPDTDSLDVTHQILRFNPKIKVLILTAYSDEVYPSRLLHIGAAGYITKDASMDELVEAIHDVKQGKRYISPEIAQNLLLKGLENVGSKPFEKLSDRELQVALMIAEGHRASAIAKQLNLSGKTINTYRYHIFEKLGVDNDVQLTLLAIKHGLVTIISPAIK